MQGWYRKGSQRKRKREIKKAKWAVKIEKVEIFMYLVAVLSILTVAVLFVSLFVLTKLDWMIALLSAMILAVSFSVKKLNPYTSFVVLILAFIGFVYLLATTVITKVTPAMNENISRYVSAVCLVVTFAVELYHSYKRMKKNSNEKIEQLERKIK